MEDQIKELHKEEDSLLDKKFLTKKIETTKQKLQRKERQIRLGCKSIVSVVRLVVVVAMQLLFSCM
jgi:hypothetical protein